jgi:hypothetical protein
MARLRTTSLAALASGFIAVAASLSVQAGQRLTPAEVAKQVDASLAAELFKSQTDLAPACDDATFLRRVWLDVVGDIPAPEHLIAFTLDPSADKRNRVVRDLLADPQYGVNWARYWRDVIFYRRIEDRALIASNALEADLSQQLNENKPWDRIAAGFITATGDVKDNGSTAIIMAQEGRTEETTAEVARIFLGMQIQCAQCHDHPYDRWKREQFHELAAFFPRIGVRPVRTATSRSFQVVASDRQFRFAKADDGNRPMPEHFMPDLLDPSAPGTQMQPKFFLTTAKLPYGTVDSERREMLAKYLTRNEWFAVAMVNRLWSELVGQGFYEPVDDVGPDRTATAPETMEILAQGFRDADYDVKWLFETIAATEAYQRQSRPRGAEDDATPFAANVPQPLRADQLYNAILSALDVPEASPQARGRGGAGGGYRGQRDQRTQFNLTFGFDPSEPRESISGSIPQSLAMMNSAQVAGSLRANRGVLSGLLAEIKDNDELITELYLRTLSRQPTDDELARAAAYLDEVGNRKQAIEDFAWALVNSAEFRHRR